MKNIIGVGIGADVVVMERCLVDRLLEMNTSNRPIKKTVVDAYKRDLAAGNWMLTNQGIGISADGVLLDGQHRLTALAQCGYPPVSMVLVWGLESKAQMCVDQGAKRSMRDVLQIVFNYTVSRMVPAICNILIQVSDGKMVVKGGVKTSSEILAVFEANQDHIMPILGIDNAAKYPAPVLAAAVVILRQNPANQVKILEFFRSVDSGENLTKNMPAFHLRNFLLASHGCKGGTAPQQERFSKTFRALSAYLNGESMGVLRA
jgi:hypothetical protein